MEIDKDFLVELRRNAYIECTENYLSTNTIAGIFGDSLPEELFYACNILPIPIEGVDAHIFKFGKEDEGDNFCDVIKSTLIYLTTQKCPILYSCKMYVVEDVCKNFINMIRTNAEKPILVYKTEEELIQCLCKVYGTHYEKPILVYKTEEELIQCLCKVYGTHYDNLLRQNAKADLDYIKSVLEKLTYYSNLSTEELFLLEFYSKYMTNLKERRNYFELLEKNISFTTKKKERKEVFALCPRGNYKYICNEINTSHAKISRVWSNADYGYSNCIFECKKEKNYKI